MWSDIEDEVCDEYGMERHVAACVRAAVEVEGWLRLGGRCIKLWMHVHDVTAAVAAAASASVRGPFLDDSGLQRPWASARAVSALTVRPRER